MGGTDAGLYFRHTDHLGSTSTATAALSDENGDQVAGSDVLFAPFGGVRTGDLSDLTDRGYTGQKMDRSADGLMYYNSRYYLPDLRRFISADTVVPSIDKSQDMNRYAYTRNNPEKYVDPTGHMPEMWTDEWWVWRYYELELWKYEDPGPDVYTKEQFVDKITLDLEQFGITVKGLENVDEDKILPTLNSIYKAAKAIGVAIYDGLSFEAQSEVGSYPSAFRAVMGYTHSITISTTTPCEDDNGEDISCNTGNLTTGANIFLRPEDLGLSLVRLIIHEFGHNFTNGPNGVATFNGDPSTYNFLEDGKDAQLVAAQNIYNYSTLSPDEVYRNPAESTANAFVAWVTGTFRQVDDKYFDKDEHLTVEQASDIVDTFFTELVNTGFGGEAR